MLIGCVAVHGTTAGARASEQHCNRHCRRLQLEGSYKSRQILLELDLEK